LAKGAFYFVEISGTRLAFRSYGKAIHALWFRATHL